MPAGSAAPRAGCAPCLAAPGVYRDLVEESGWSPDQVERWVGDALERYAMGGQATDG